MKHLKRLLIVLIFFGTGIESWAYDEIARVDGLVYEFFFNDNTATLRYDNNYRGDIVVPATVQYKGKTYTVVKIGDKAFYDNQRIKSIQLPNTIKVIDYRAFNESCLDSIVLPESLEKIDEMAFTATKIRHIVIPKNVKTIKKTAFIACRQLESIELNSDEIPERIFAECEKLKHVVIGPNVKTIGWRSFYKCVSLESILIPANITGLTSEAFYFCTGLKKVVFENSNVEFNGSPFIGCDSIVDVKYNNKELEGVMFSGCKYGLRAYAGEWTIKGKAVGPANPATVNISVTLNADGTYTAKLGHTNSYNVNFRNGTTGPAKEVSNGTASGRWRNPSGGIVIEGGRQTHTATYTERGAVVKTSLRAETGWDTMYSRIFLGTFIRVDNNLMKNERINSWELKRTIKNALGKQGTTVRKKK